MPGLQKIPKEIILDAIAKIGPSQPIDIRKEIKQGDTMLIGAMLSEFVASGQLIISKTRRGGSPFYYDPRAPESLEKIGQYLNEKDRRTWAMLQQQKVMREDAQEPLVRVGLQNIFDFSRRMIVDENGATVVYWRYYLVPEDEAKRLIKGEKSPAARKAVDVDEKKEILKDESGKDESEPEKKPALVKEKKKRAPRAKTTAQTMQPTSQDWLAHDMLYEKIQSWATAQKGIVTNAQSIRANTELTFALTTDGPHGKLTVLVYALNKKKITEKEITKVLLGARGQGMPLLVLSVEDVPAKLTRSFEMLNVYFKKL